MSSHAKGYNKIDDLIHKWGEEDRQEVIDFALDPSNGVTSVMLYLQSKSIRVSISVVHKWIRTLKEESERTKLMRSVFDDYAGVTPNEVNAFLAAFMTQTMIDLKQIIEKDGLDARKIQSLTALAKEARSSAIAMNTPTSTASMKELELGHALSFAQRLEGIFEGDDVVLERVRSACKAIMVEIEGQYGN